MGRRTTAKAAAKVEGKGSEDKGMVAEDAQTSEHDTLNPIKQRFVGRIQKTFMHEICIAVGFSNSTTITSQ